MTKKEYVMKALYALEPYRNLAPELIKLMENNEIADEGIVGLYNILSKAIDEVADDKLRKRLVVSRNHIKKIQGLEKDLSEKELEELDELENLIQSV